MENAESLFIKSIRSKYRFGSNRGQLTTEDLWDLSLNSLDEIAIAIHDDLEKVGKRSFVRQKTKQSDDLSSKLDVVKYVIETKVSEAAQKAAQTKKKGQLDFLKKLKEQKEIEQLEGMSMEDLNKQIAELESQV